MKLKESVFNSYLWTLDIYVSLWTSWELTENGDCHRHLTFFSLILGPNSALKIVVPVLPEEVEARSLFFSLFLVLF